MEWLLTIFLKLRLLLIHQFRSAQDLPQTSETQRFFSQENTKKYFVKREFAHLPDGRVAFMSPIRYGPVHDFHIFLSRRKIYGQFLMKSPHELSSNESQHWPIIADMRYIGINGYLPDIIPTKGNNLC
ncbi:hypothetical protein BB558_001657 [Smittium angustum]|uniref:DDE Tnp4 domain-containing protein n=1 Tax=Smittium angustum TaxID=133377 RepID=A0A2U1JB27_SMIAN|nr:hypothetical protein BB558_001657 [Smittium angustum]